MAAAGVRRCQRTVRDGCRITRTREGKAQSGSMLSTTVYQLNIRLGDIQEKHVGNGSKVHASVLDGDRRQVGHGDVDVETALMMKHVESDSNGSR